MPFIKATHGLGKAVPNAFNNNLPKKLSLTVPPREPVSLDFPAAMQRLESSLSELESIEFIRQDLANRPQFDVLEVCFVFINLFGVVSSSEKAVMGSKDFER